jgi:hypothetical protein
VEGVGRRVGEALQVCKTSDLVADWQGFEDVPNADSGPCGPGS